MNKKRVGRKGRNRIFKKVDKKAALTTQQIVIFVVLIASFAVILFLYARLGFGGVTKKDICHDSVVKRGNNLLSKISVPLKCQTGYVCFSANSECDVPSMPNPDEIITISSNNPPTALSELNKNIANLMADCWWMYGEGKIDYLGTEGISSDKNYCSNCYQIAFDDSLYENDGPLANPGYLSEASLYSYLIKNNVPGKEINYMSYFLGRNVPSEDSQLNGLNFKDLDFSKNYYLTMAITSKSNKALRIITALAVDVGIIAAVLLTGGSALIAIAGVTVVGVVAIDSDAPPIFLGTSVQGDSGNKFLTPTIVEVGSDQYKLLNCADVKTLS